MWVILKIDTKKLNLFNADLKRKIGKDFKLYIPKISTQFYKKNKLINKNVPLLGDYIFCFHKKFDNSKIVEGLKFTKGLKYFLEGYHLSQNEINVFVDKFKSLENNSGFITQNFLNLNLNSFYRFKSGPFTNKIFQLIEMQKNKIKILINGVKIKTENNSLIFTYN